MTLAELIASSLRKAGVIRETQNPSAEQYEAAVDTFNEMMAEFDTDNIVIGDFPIESVGEETAIDRSYLGAVKVLFAVHLAADHGVPVDPTIAALVPDKQQFLARATKIRPRTRVRLPGGRATRIYDV